ncbi:MAG: hypothetical protein ACXV2J_07530 [Actinomycetes bacterium]
MSRPPLVHSPLALVGGLVGLQGVVLLVVAAFYVVELVVATASDVTAALVTVLLVLVAAAGLLLVARGLLRAERWARSPALVTNLILVPVSVGLLQSGRWYVGLPLLAWAATVVVLLFSRGVNAALDRADPDEQR